MALTSKFYDGPVTETDRATSRAGAPDYGVYDVDDFKVSAHPSIPYALNVKAGKAHGFGVTDTAATDQTVQADSMASGTRFDLVVVRRNWQPLLGGPSTLVIIKGGSTMPNIQTVRTIGPGVEDDQPIALLEWRGNVNTPNSIIDLRCWAGNGGIVAADKLALNYLARPGADVLIGTNAWRYTMGANGVWGWTDMGAGKPFAMAAGTIAVPNFLGGGKADVTINLPVGRFSVPPIVTASSGNYRLTASVGVVTKTTAALSLFNTATSQPGGSVATWHAVQMTPTSAAG